MLWKYVVGISLPRRGQVALFVLLMKRVRSRLKTAS